ncbi:DUF4365 domain-containing protein [Nitrosomonas oligotropha]|uniref:DUF4365 domain-containing protein n=1 Tax=Nitrosomonas oligotropha TaxID=42354 RepID=UPI00136BA667|nr:DUF4365 domain-containing protein [Nitrosomonas oligotropha]MXS83859.1 DUF4365 domain-containing protein [Nitrosomonas oligotropha]
MLPTQTIEELISVSYVSAIIAYSGFAPNAVAKDYGIDLEVRKIGEHRNKRIDLGAFLELQLKASINWSAEDAHVVFDLEADAYNRLVFRRDNSSMPCALVVCCFPKEKEAWLNVAEDELMIRKCCYYHFIDGAETKNTSSQRIRIPRNQLLTPESLHELKQKLYEGALS